MRIPSLDMNLSPFYYVSMVTLTNYLPPERMAANVMPTNGAGDIIALGQTFPDYLRIKQSITDDLLKFKPNDKIYWNKPIPDVHSVTQSTPDSANYIVIGKPTVTKNIIDVRLKIITGR